MIRFKTKGTNQVYFHSINALRNQIIVTIVLYITEEMQRKIEKMQEELMKVQLKYQKELEKLERENKELRKQLLLRGSSIAASRKIKV